RGRSRAQIAARGRAPAVEQVAIDELGRGAAAAEKSGRGGMGHAGEGGGQRQRRRRESEFGHEKYLSKGLYRSNRAAIVTEYPPVLGAGRAHPKGPRERSE